jgi:PAS domain S-box-containing protein
MQMHTHDILSRDEMYCSPDVLYVLDSKETIVKCNRRFLEVSGYDSSEISYIVLENLFSDNDLKKMRKAIQQVKLEGEVSFQNRIIGKDGNAIELSITGWLVPNSDGSMARTAWIGREIRDPENFSSPKRENERYYRTLFNEMSSAYLLCEILPDRRGKLENIRFLDANTAFERLTGLKKKHILGKPADETPQWMKDHLTRIYTQVIENNKTYRCTEYLQEIDRFCEIIAFSPNKHRLIALLMDVTENKKAEEEKKYLHLQLIQSQKLEGIGRLAGGIAHDFNNLLTAILGYTDLALIQTENREQLHENLSQIRFATQRAAKLVQQLLIFSRKQSMEFKPHNLSEVIENLLKMLKRIIGEDIKIALELYQSLWMAKIDRTQIEQVIMNLAVNARDAMAKGGQLRIKTENVLIDRKYVKSYSFARPGKFICLSIEDNGSGMSLETQQKMFEPFFTTKRSGEGTGLGLSMVYGIIKEHQGWITVTSELGKGSVFKIYLPAFDKPTISNRSIHFDLL